MRITAFDQMLNEASDYTKQADVFLQSTIERFQAAKALYDQTSIRFCDAQAKLEQAQAIHRAVTVLVAQRQVKFSDMAAFGHWI